MNQYEEKASVADSSYLPPLADERNIQPRLVRLAALLGQICEKLVDCPFAAKAHGYVDAALCLELVNFDLMNAICQTMISVQFCNAIRTLREHDASDLVIEAAKLADDILIDMPLGLGLGVDMPAEPSHENAEEESENLVPIVLRGRVCNLLSGTKGVDETVGIFEFAGSYSVLAFPSTWAKYRDQLAACERDETYIAIKVQALKTGDYGLIEILPSLLPEESINLAPINDETLHVPSLEEESND